MKQTSGVMGIVNNALLAVIAVLMAITGHFAQSIYDEFLKQRSEIKDLQLNERVNDVKVRNTLNDHERRLDDHDARFRQMKPETAP